MSQSFSYRDAVPSQSNAGLKQVLPWQPAVPLVGQLVTPDLPRYGYRQSTCPMETQRSTKVTVEPSVEDPKVEDSSAGRKPQTDPGSSWALTYRDWLDSVVPVRESLVLFPNMFSVALSGAVSLASMVSTLPADQKWDRSSVMSFTGC